MLKEFQKGKFYLGRLPYESDLLEFLQSYVIENNITCGIFNLIGAVKKAAIGFYDSKAKQYKTITLNEPLEILSCQGNISLKDQKPFIHAHITLADSDGKAFGGHLMPGCIVFAAELFLQSLEGEPLERKPDSDTNLFLWES